MRFFKKTKGITLVALVITIIILLILVGITISQLTNSGLFENTQLAKRKYEDAQTREDDILKQYENALENSDIVSDRDMVTIPKEEYDILKNANLYSTEEKEIGIWTDNSKLYKKTYTDTLSSTNATQYISIDNSYDVKSVEAIIFNGTVRLSSGFFDGTNRFCAGIDNHRIFLMRNSTEVWTGCTTYVTIEYTKTATN